MGREESRGREERKGKATRGRKNIGYGLRRHTLLTQRWLTSR